ncbi:MAG: FAD-dependent oxidoreductase [Candidatus Omnitrophota bacterium]|nr:MAG: FAD-dependent oxidoreductase [Candidatus Omnitrophota bacterium]
MKRRNFFNLTALTSVGILLPKNSAHAEPSSDEQNTIREEAKNIPVIAEADICVLGGSCTGVFAAIRAARLGAKVVIVEKQNCFGGTATGSMVNVWHSPYDAEFQQQIIGGLTMETIERLKKRNAVFVHQQNVSHGFDFNSDELKVELDEMVLAAHIKPYLHTIFSAPVVKDGELIAVLVENKSGRGAIKANIFVDATGDGDLCHRLELPTYTAEQLQPPTMCARFADWRSLKGFDLNKTVLENREKYHLPEGFSWGAYVPGSDVYMLAGTRVYGVNCADADDLTNAEMEGRRQVRAIHDIIREHCPQSKITLQALPSQIGIRETRHVRCGYQLTGDDVLYGKRFDDAIANGSYRVDIHHQNKPGITLRYLNGTEQYSRPGFPSKTSRWREETATNPTFYQIPLRSLIPGGRYRNIITAGRMLDADRIAFSAVRVMVNMNQTGEAAGTAAWLALSSNTPINNLDPQEVRKLLAKEGAIIL